VYVYVDLSGLSVQDAPRVDAVVALQVRTCCAPSARLPAPLLLIRSATPRGAACPCFWRGALYTVCIYITLIRVVTKSAERCCAGPRL